MEQINTAYQRELLADLDAQLQDLHTVVELQQWMQTTAPSTQSLTAGIIHKYQVANLRRLLIMSVQHKVHDMQQVMEIKPELYEVPLEISTVQGMLDYFQTKLSPVELAHVTMALATVSTELDPTVVATADQVEVEHYTALLAPALKEACDYSFNSNCNSRAEVVRKAEKHGFSLLVKLLTGLREYNDNLVTAHTRRRIMDFMQFESHTQRRYLQKELDKYALVTELTAWLKPWLTTNYNSRVCNLLLARLVEIPASELQAAAEIRAAITQYVTAKLQTVQDPFETALYLQGQPELRQLFKLDGDRLPVIIHMQGFAPAAQNVNREMLAGIVLMLSTLGAGHVTMYDINVPTLTPKVSGPAHQLWVGPNMYTYSATDFKAGLIAAAGWAGVMVSSVVRF